MRKTLFAVVVTLSGCERPADTSELERRLQQTEAAALDRSTELIRLRQRVTALESENARLKEQVALRLPASDEVPVGPASRSGRFACATPTTMFPFSISPTARPGKPLKREISWNWSRNKKRR